MLERKECGSRVDVVCSSSVRLRGREGKEEKEQEDVSPKLPARQGFFRRVHVICDRDHAEIGFGHRGTAGYSWSQKSR